MTRAWMAPGRLIGLILLSLAWLALSAPLSAPLAQARQAFPELTGRVVDQAGLVSDEREAALTQRLAALEAQTGAQLVVVTLDDLGDMAIEDYGYRLGRHWGIGQSDGDTGVLLIVAPNDRKVRIEVGYGLEPVLTDALSALIIQEQMLPAFRVGGFERGIEQGANAIIAQLSLDPAQAEARALATEPKNTRFPFGILVAILVIVIFTGVVAMHAPRLRGRKRRSARGDGLTPILIWAASEALRDAGRSGGGRSSGGGGFGGGGFRGGGGSFGGGGASGGW